MTETPKQQTITVDLTLEGFKYFFTCHCSLLLEVIKKSNSMSGIDKVDNATRIGLAGMLISEAKSFEQVEKIMKDLLKYGMTEFFSKVNE